MTDYGGLRCPPYLIRSNGGRKGGLAELEPGSAAGEQLPGKINGNGKIAGFAGLCWRTLPNSCRLLPGVAALAWEAPPNQLPAIAWLCRALPSLSPPDGNPQAEAWQTGSGA